MTTDLISNFALLTAFMFLMNSLLGKNLDTDRAQRRTRFNVAVLHGFFAICLMYFSVAIAPHTFVDFRQIMIISSASVGGFLPALLTGLIVAIGRIVLFGGLNQSSLLGAVSALLVALGSGLLAIRFRQAFVRFWTYSLLFSIAASAVTLLVLLGKGAADVLPFFLCLTLVGGLFVASLMAYFSRANRLQRELEASEKRYKQLHDMQESILQSASGVAIIASDLNGLITLFNKGAENMLGYRAEEVEGRHTPMLFHTEEEITRRAKEVSARLGREIAGFDVLVSEAKEGRAEEREFTYIRKDGSFFKGNVIVTPVRGSDGSIIGFMSVSTDITERKRAEETLRKANDMLRNLSLQDGLTGIANRRRFDQALMEAWSESEARDRDMAFILFDIDSFKKFNDTYGHQAGDDCLIRVATAAKACLVRDEEVIARYGGEEFAVILPEGDLALGIDIAEAIRASIESLGIPHSGAHAGGVVTVSLGVAARKGGSSPSAQELVAEADRALYQAKLSGRNRVCSQTAVINLSAGGQETVR